MVSPKPGGLVLAGVVAVIVAGAFRVMGPEAETVNPPVSVPLPPLGFVAVTSRTPGVAPLEIVSVAVSWAPEATATFDTVMPAPAVTVAPATNPDPLIVTGTAVPGAPWFGVTELTVIAGARAARA